MSYQETSLQQAIADRRSIRILSTDSSVTKERLEKIIQNSLCTPSAFSMQSSRLVVLMDKEHKHFWKLVEEALAPLLKDAESLAATKERLAGFAAGNGTILFFENKETVEAMQKNFPSYSDNFTVWSEHGNAMLQYALWLSLSADGIAASLQHYNPLVDSAVQSTWGVDSKWKLIAQMPFGKAAETPGERAFLPFDTVVSFHE
ncbi:nitroreductase family protein [Oscillospiraceae bacterium MB08-C2-2]|nr:nitroreductase family protein [Oscillospiraceae bacterium MB08-C2-2]